MLNEVFIINILIVDNGVLNIYDVDLVWISLFK